MRYHNWNSPWHNSLSIFFVRFSSQKNVVLPYIRPKLLNILLLNSLKYSAPVCCSLTQRCKLIEDNRGERETWWRQIVPQLNSLCRCLCRDLTAGAADKWQKVQKKGWGGYIQNSERDKRENSWVHNKSFHFLHWKTGAQGRGGILSPPEGGEKIPKYEQLSLWP